MASRAGNTVVPERLALSMAVRRHAAVDEETDPKSRLTMLMDAFVAVDVNAYRDAPTGLRIWGGPTVDPEDMERLLPWIDWAYETVRADHQQTAA